jgi:hypothetical protein
MKQTQTGHVAADVVTGERRRRGAPQRGNRSAARRRSAGRRARRTNPRGGVYFVTGVAVIVAIATATFGIEAYVRSGHEQSRIATLQADLAGLQQRVAVDEHGAASERSHVRSVAAQASTARRALARFSWALQSVPSEAQVAGQVAGVRSALAAYAACIPQLQNEIAGLGIDWRVDPMKPSTDYFKLATTAPISASCSSALNGR